MASSNSSRFADILAVEEFIEGQEKKNTKKQNECNGIDDLNFYKLNDPATDIGDEFRDTKTLKLRNSR